MSDYIYKYLVVHFVCMFVGLFVELINSRTLYVRDLFFSFIFGPFYMLTAMGNFDRIIIELPPRKK